MKINKKIFYIILVFSLISLIPTYASPQKIKTIDGVKYIINGEKPNPPKKTPFQMILTEEICIGESGEEEEAFSETIFIAVDDKENIYVMDMKLNNIKVFNALGEYVRTIAKQGQGPGELNMPIGIQITLNEELMVEEALNRRLSYFTLEGKFLRSTSTADKTSLSGLILGPKGNMVGRELALEENKMWWIVKKYDKDLNELFTVDRVEFPNPLQGKINPFELMIVFNIDPNGNIIYGISKDYEIKFISPEGKHIKSITKKHTPIKITDKDKKEMLDRIPETMTINLKERIEFPKHFPAFQSFTIDKKGRIFVRTFQKGKEEGEYMVDIFDSEGCFISQIPLKINPVLWKNNKLFATEESDQGYIIIKRYKVLWE